MRLDFSLLGHAVASAALVVTFLTPASFAADAASVASVKSQILEIAQANQQRVDNLADVRSQLDPLVKQLLELAPSKLEAEQKALVAGGWRNIWADLPFPPTVDRTENYQVVSPNGFYYNVSRQTFLGFEGTGYLRGAYTDAGRYLDIVFTRNALVPSWPAAGTKLLDLANDVESGKLVSYDVPGPNGVTGTLKNAYVDQDLRVITGGDVVGDAGLLFIMTRADTIQ